MAVSDFELHVWCELPLWCLLIEAGAQQFCGLLMCIYCLETAETLRSSFDQEAPEWQFTPDMQLKVTNSHLEVRKRDRAGSHITSDTDSGVQKFVNGRRLCHAWHRSSRTQACDLPSAMSCLAQTQQYKKSIHVQIQWISQKGPYWEAETLLLGSPLRFAGSAAVHTAAGSLQLILF